MATKPYSTVAFIEQLLAPIAEGEEQADTKAFQRELLHDLERNWSMAYRNVRILEARHLVAITEADQLDIAPHQYGPAREAFRALREGRLAQCLVPAPTGPKMRWKERLVRYRRDTPPEVLAAIERDRVRLGL